jgi:hypothetical protein
MRTFGQWSAIAAISVAMFAAGPANAADTMQTKVAGPYRIELHVLPVEPFYTKQDVTDKKLTDGMEIEGGAAPVAANADSHPNHHLVVNVSDKKTGKVVTDAAVSMSFVLLDAKDGAVGAPVAVPVVVMQMIGKGSASTHYGNNVTMAAGRYRVTVAVNGRNVVFAVGVSDAPAGAMAPMKM